MNKKIKSYHVILTSLVDAFRDVDVDNPETRQYRFDIDAENATDALFKAKEQHNLSVWESDCYEN